MDNQNQEVPQATSNYQWLRTLSIGFGIVSFGIAIGVIGYILGTKNSQTVVQNQQNTNIPTLSQPSPTPTIDETANWKIYKVNSLNLEFKLPPKFTQFGELKEEVESVQPPSSGKELCVTFPKQTSFFVKEAYAGAGCAINYFGISTISSDYNVGRGATFTDLQGFTYKNGKHYFSKLTDKETEIPSDSVQKINNPYGVEIIKIKYSHVPTEEMPPIYYTGEENVGALVNTTNNKIFPGFAVLLELKNNITEEDFDQILSTFQFTP